MDFNQQIWYSIHRGEKYMSDIGSRLREARINKCLKQSKLAELIQCSSKAISRYEKNENLDKVYDFAKMCECLDANINYIFHLCE